MVETLTTTSSMPRSWANHHHHHKTLLTALCLAFFFTVFYWQRDAAAGGFSILRRPFPLRQLPKLRPVAFNLTDFGAVGDGVTLNTVAFEKTVMAISKLGKKGGDFLPLLHFCPSCYK